MPQRSKKIVQFSVKSTLKLMDEEKMEAERRPLMERNTSELREESNVRIPWKARIKRYSLSEGWLSAKIAFNSTLALINAGMIAYDVLLMEQSLGGMVAQSLWFNILDVAIALSLIGGVIMRMWLQWSSIGEYFETRSNIIDSTIALLCVCTLPIAYFELSFPNGSYSRSFDLLYSLRTFRDVCRMIRQFYFVKWALSSYKELNIVREGYVDVDEATARYLARRLTTRANLSVPSFIDIGMASPTAQGQQSPGATQNCANMWNRAIADALPHQKPAE